jgi:uncharacterized membrane protein (DUF4010 family)
MAMTSLGSCAWLWRRSRTRVRGTVNSGPNPFKLSQAIQFGLAFGLIMVAARAAQTFLGSGGLYLAGALAGLTDVDAISLTMANLASTNPGITSIAGTTIVVAVLSNTLVKYGMVAAMGAPQLRNQMLPWTILVLAAGGMAALLMG